ncbi:MAG: glycosyltransferase [Micrococcaceae bacterium]
MLNVLAVNYFSSDVAKQYIESFQSQTYKDWNLYIVDNSENVSELNKLRAISDDARVKIIDAKKNQGFFGAAQYGFSKNICEVASNDLVIVSNLDLYFDNENTLQELVNITENYDDVGVFAPDIYSIKRNSHQNPMLKNRPSEKAMKLRTYMHANTYASQFSTLVDLYSSALREKLGNKRDIKLKEQDIYAAHGSFMIFTSEFFARGGNFNYEVFLYGEELYVAEQCKKLGLRIILIPSVVVHHITNYTFGTWQSKKILRYKVQAAKHGYEMLYGSKKLN